MNHEAVNYFRPKKEKKQKQQHSHTKRNNKSPT